MREIASARERVSVCMREETEYVCVRDGETEMHLQEARDAGCHERARVFRLLSRDEARVCVRERENMCVRERERVCVCAPEREIYI